MSLDKYRGGEKPAAASNILALLESPKVHSAFQAVAGKVLDPNRLVRLCIFAVNKTPKLTLCDPKSVLGAMITSATLGLEPNTIQGHAYLIPYKRRAYIDGKWDDVHECQFQIGYRGFVDLAYRSPRIDSIHAEAIHENDMFEHMQGSDSFLRYKKSLKDRGALIGAYCHTKIERVTGATTEIATVLPLDEIYKIRSRSETFRALTAAVENAQSQKDIEKAKQKLADTPWVMFEDDMSAKSALKKGAKMMPLRGDMLVHAAELDSAADAGEIDLGAMVDPDVARGVVIDGYAPPEKTDPNATREHVQPQGRTGETDRQQATQQSTKSEAENDPLPQEAKKRGPGRPRKTETEAKDSQQTTPEQKQAQPENAKQESPHEGGSAQGNLVDPDDDGFGVE